MRKQILLLEMYNLRMTLLENRLEFLKKNYLPRLAQYIQTVNMPVNVLRAARILPTQQGETPEMQGEKLLNYVTTFDPDPAKKNTQWLLNLLLKGRNDGNGNITRAMQFEDLPSVRDLLVQFQQHARALPAANRDIMRYKSPGDLAAVLQPLAQQAPVVSNRGIERQEEAKAYAQSTVLFNDAQYRILIPHTREAAVYFGRNTRWCTAADKNNMFSHYNERGQLYVILDKKNNKRWQFHWEDNQFMDEMDRSINKQDFCAAHPTIAKFFEDYMHGGEVIAHYGAYTLYKNEHSITIRSDNGDDGTSARGIHARAADATLTLKDGYIVSGDISVLFNGTRRRRSYYNNTFTSFPLDINEGGDVVEPLMNKIGMPVRAAIQNQLADIGVFGNDQGQFGSLAEMGKPVLTVSRGSQWVELDSGSLRFFALVENGEEITYARLNVGQGDDHGLFEASAPNMNKPEGAAEAKALFALVTHLPDITRFPTDDKHYNSGNFDELQAKQIMTTNANLTDLGVLFKALGPNNPRVQQAVVAQLRQGGFDITDKSFLDGGKRIVLEQYKDIGEFISNWGTDYSQRVAGQLWDGDGFDVGYEGEASSSDRNDMVEHLQKTDPALFAKLAAWVEQTCADEIANCQEEDEDYTFDPNDIDQWFDLLDMNGDESIQDAANSAYQTGSNRGAENDMYERFIQDIEGYPDLFFMVENEPERPHQLEIPFKGDENDISVKHTTEFMHDTKVVIAPELGRVIQALLSPEWEDEIGNTGGSWLSYLQDHVGEDDVKLDHEEPHYGYSGYDNDAANEQFSDEIHQLVG